MNPEHFTAHIDNYEKVLAEGIEEENITEQEAWLALSEYAKSESDTVDE